MIGLSIDCSVNGVLFSNKFAAVTCNLQLLNAHAEGSAANPLAAETQFSEFEGEDSTLSIIVVGASGDLAKKKIFPALFALYYEDWLPEVLSSFPRFLLCFFPWFRK